MAATEQNQDTIPSRVFLWTNPRSLSTAFEKCVGLIDGVEVWHEPYVTCYLNLLFGTPKYVTRFTKLNTMIAQFASVTKLLEGEHIFKGGNLVTAETFTHDWLKEQLSKPLKEGKKVRFIKDAPWGVIDNYHLLPEMPLKHTFIIRHPNRTSTSYRNIMIEVFGHEGDPNDFDMHETNPFMTWELLPSNPVYRMYNYVRENIEPNPVVIDADDLQNHPEEIMTKYCEAVGIPFEKKHVQWDKSDESLKYFHGSLDQFVWGKQKHIYDGAFLSSSFLPIKCKIPETVPSGCQIYAQELLEGYKEMYENRLKPTD